MGAIGFGPDTARAQQARPWKQDVDAEGHKLFDLGSLAMRDNPTEIGDFEGQGLTIDSSGVLNATGTSPWQSGDFVNLATFGMGTAAKFAAFDPSYRDADRVVVPFADLSSGAFDLHVSVSGAVKGDNGDSAAARLIEEDTASVIGGTEANISTTGSWKPFHGPKVSYDPNQLQLIRVQIKADTANPEGASFAPLQVHVWGEVT